MEFRISISSFDLEVNVTLSCVADTQSSYWQYFADEKNEENGNFKAIKRVSQDQNRSEQFENF